MHKVSIGQWIETTPRRTQNCPPGCFVSNADALELTVAHKTVAEPD
jgi:hypothetical protein